MTWDNYFSSDKISDYVGQKSVGMMCTVQRSQLPKGVPSKYFHKEQTAPGDKEQKLQDLINQLLP